MPDFDMDVRESVPPRFEDKYDRLAYLLAEYKLPVSAALLVGGFVVLTGRAQVPDIPPWAKLALQGFALGIIPATILGKKLVVDKFMPDNAVKVALVDFEDGVRTIDAKRVPPTVWQDRKRGEWPELAPDEGEADWLVTELEWHADLQQLEVEGVNPELVDPTELIGTQGKLEEIYGDLLDQATKLTRMEATLSTKAQQIERQNVNALVAAMEHGLAFNPGDTQEIVKGEEWGELGVDADDREERSDTPDETLRTLSDELEAHRQANGGGGGSTEIEADGGRNLE